MTIPPDFGGRDLEEGLQEDLGAPPERYAPAHEDEEGPAWEDNEAHAPGTTCAVCGGVIAAGQDVRRRADGRWMHEVCP